MKKLLSIICVLSLLTVAGVSSANAQSPLSLGIRGGLNFANLNNVDGSEARTGFMAGAYFNFKVPMSPVSIQPEVLYSQKGYEAGGTSVNLDYIEVPVLAKFGFMTAGPVSPNVYFGPYFAFNINAEAEGTLISGNIDDSIKDTDFGVVVGGELDISKFNVGVRYNAGLTKIAEDDSDGKNGVFSIVAGINF